MPFFVVSGTKDGVCIWAMRFLTFSIQIIAPVQLCAAQGLQILH